MKRNVQNGSSKITGSTVRIIAGILVFTAVSLVVIFLAVKEANEVKNYDSYGFHLGNMLSSIQNIITVSDNVNAEEREEYANLVEKLYTADEIQIEDYIACLQYAESLKLNDERELISRTIDLIQAESEARVITKDAFWGGYAVSALMPVIVICNERGIVSDRDYKDMNKRYLELMEKPTEKKVYEYVQKGDEILKFLGF